MGNWLEDRESKDAKLKDYMAKKDSGKLVINSTQ
jgi:hypothetical protein